METIGERIRATRESKGMKGVDLAKAVGILPKDLWRYEAGHVKSPGADIVGRLALALNVSTDYLIHGDSTPTVVPHDAAE